VRNLDPESLSWCLFILHMRRLKRLTRWALITLGAMVAVLLLAHLVLRPNPDQAESEQYVVYSAYIEPNLTGESHDLGSRSGLIVIDANPIFSDQFLNKSKFNQYRFLLGTASHAKARIPQLRRSVLFEFFIANLRDEPLERRFLFSAKYELATKQETNLYPSEQFLRRFPRSYGYLTFSRVAFNRDLTEAFFYTEHLCGLCGEGKYVFMRKVNGNWVVERTASSWIS
jgi:hypothetical protein